MSEAKGKDGCDAAEAVQNGRMVRLILPSDICYLPLVNAVTEEFARELSLDQEAVEAVALSVVEASTNAISHGNRYDASKDIEIAFGRAGDALVVTVKDQGKGFDPGAVPDPLAPENLLRESGRGIFICRSFMDDVQFEFGPGRGTTIRLLKRFKPETATGGGRARPGGGSPADPSLTDSTLDGE